MRAKNSKQPLFRVFTAMGIFALTMVMGIGIFGATMGMWLPRISG